jgi:hypothetical protein
MSGFLGSDGALARRSRYGDSHAARRLAARHLDRISLLASVVADSPDEAAALTRRGFRLSLRGSPPYEDALVRAFGRLAAQRPDAGHAQGRLLVLLVEVEGRPSGEAAALLGLPAATARAMLPAARAATGPAQPARPCRGWGLVSSGSTLTGAERAAGQAHLLLCRRCRDRRAAVDRTRAQLLGGSAGVVGAIAATQVVPLGSSAVAGLGGVLATKGAAAVVATLGTAVLATASTVAVTEPAGFRPQHRPPAVGTPAPASTPASASPGTGPGPGATVSPGPALPTVPVPVPLPTAVPRSKQPLPLPTDVLPLPTDLLPTSVPLPLPSLPLPLPTAIDLPDLLP